ncbi:hypothetical protein DFP72DRAFT_860363 [Ephemerocybe angulata]|uniref:Uncharacterized protein n=1 Tax=Ephemerocybe angulata TaxID=980116 RepID=A0A8H6H8V4_9AGAR|nr:hypothetical protein DFP72DRAFT_860363 [Tulosesus angulatus]
MRDLLGFLIRSIDLRTETAPTCGGYHRRVSFLDPETCAVCDGTGFIMVPCNNTEPESDENDDAVTVPDSETDDDDADDDGPIRGGKRVLQLAPIGYRSLPAFANASAAASAAAFAAAASAAPPSSVASAAPVLMTPPPTAPGAPATIAHTVSAPDVIATASVAPTVMPATIAPSAPALVIPTGTPGATALAAQAAPSPGAASATPSAPVPAAVSLAPPVTGTAPTAVAPPAPAPAVVTATQVQGIPATVPPCSTVILGFHSLGPNTPPPAPTNAVFASPGEERYYIISKGIRVGVFGGWANTSPYVTGVASASFGRHRTLLSAYEAYVSAWSKGAVAYV